MAVLRTFRVSLYPVERSSFGSLCTKMMIGGSTSYPEKHFSASTADEVVAVVTRFAREHGEPCDAFVRIVEGRKPAGFDEKCKRLVFNLEKLPEVAQAS